MVIKLDPRSVKHKNQLDSKIIAKSSFSLLKLANLISKLLLVFIIVASSVVLVPGYTYEYYKNVSTKTILFKNMSIDNTNVVVVNEEIPVQIGKTVLMKKVLPPPPPPVVTVAVVPKKEVKKTKVELPKVKVAPPITAPVKEVTPPKVEAPVEKPIVSVDETPLAAEYKSLDLRYPSSVTAAEINNYIQGYCNSTGKTSVLSGKGQMLIDVASSAGINQLVFAAMTIHESGFATSGLSKTKFNIFSIAAYTGDNAWDSAYRYESVDQAIRYQAHFMKALYLSPVPPPGNWSRFKGYTLGDKTTGMNFYYAADANWGQAIANHANKIHPFTTVEYPSTLPMMSGSTTKVELNDYYDDFSSMNIVGLTKASVNLYNDRTSTNPFGAMVAGSNFTVLGKTNDNWLKVKYLINGVETVCFMKGSFDKYTQYYTILNLMRSKTTFVYSQQIDGTELPSGYVTVYR
ncbi:MAG: peptide-binding protein [Bacillales bacterium]|nr:peptide-binding protein [Bacillales bacterium]